jgi:hypothetical protein
MCMMYEYRDGRSWNEQCDPVKPDYDRVRCPEAFDFGHAKRFSRVSNCYQSLTSCLSSFNGLPQ